MSHSNDSSVADGGPTGRTDTQPHHNALVPSVVDWIVAVLFWLGGLASIAGGAALVWVADETLLARTIADGVNAGTVTLEGISQTDFVTIATPTLYWVGVGLLVTGVTIIAVGTAFLWVRRTGDDAGVRSERAALLTNGVYGAVVSSVAFFVPFSQVVGGAAAGYLQRHEYEGTIATGAVAGGLPSLSVVLIFLFGSVGLADGLGAAGYGGLTPLVLFGLLVVVAFTLAISAGLGALGGWLGGKLAGDRLERRRSDVP